MTDYPQDATTLEMITSHMTSYQKQIAELNLLGIVKGKIITKYVNAYKELKVKYTILINKTQNNKELINENTLKTIFRKANKILYKCNDDELNELLNKTLKSYKADDFEFNEY